MTTKWSPSTSTSSRRRRQRWPRRRSRWDCSIGTMSSSGPWTHQTGTSSGTCWAGSNAASSGPAGGRGRPSTAPPPSGRSSAAHQVEHPGLGDDVGDRHPRVARRPAAQVARWPPAEWPSVTHGRGVEPVDARRRWSMPAATSSRVAGSPPPLPTRRYSRFQVAQPARDQARGQRTSQRQVVRRLPEPAVDHDHHAARLAVGQRQLAELAGVVAVAERCGSGGRAHGVILPAAGQQGRRRTPSRARRPSLG